MIDVQATTAHICRRIREAKVIPDPWPHLVIEEFLPGDVFAQLLAAIPEAWLRAPAVKRRSWVAPLAGGGMRALPEDDAQRWGERDAAALADVFRAIGREREIFGAIDRPLRTQISAAIERFQARFANDVAPRQITRFTRDSAAYDLRPHTDVPTKLASIIHYVQSDPAPRLGTILYRPIDEAFRCRGLDYHDPALFREVAEVPFRPNAALVFVRDDRTFHGVAYEANRPDFARVTIQSNFWMTDLEVAALRPR